MSREAEVTVPVWTEWLDSVSEYFEYESYLFKWHFDLIRSCDFEIQRWSSAAAKLPKKSLDYQLHESTINRMEENRAKWLEEAKKLELELIDFAIEDHRQDDPLAADIREAIRKGQTINTKEALLNRLKGHSE
jgi:hypothetical protein